MTKSKKRKSNITPDADISIFKRQKTGDESDLTGPQPRPDPSTGQRSFFPGLDNDDSDSDPEAEPVNGLDYLRRVRLEARGIPSLLRAPRAVDEAADESHGKGYYEDGAYVSIAKENGGRPIETAEGSEKHSRWREAPLAPADVVLPNSSDLPSARTHRLTPQDAYRTRLLARFYQTRRTISSEPPLRAVQSLSSQRHLISLPASSRAHAAWRYQVQNHAPAPAQLATMDRGSVLRALELCGVVGLKKRKPVNKTVGAWMFALMAKLGDVEILDNDAVAVVREVGKRAVAMTEYLGSGKVEQDFPEQDSDDEEQETEGDTPMADDGDRATDGAETIESAKTRLLSRLEESAPEFDSPHRPRQSDPDDRVTPPRASASVDDHPQPTASTEEEDRARTHGTLDMIITIAGEAFGQRDLLHSRETWS